MYIIPVEVKESNIEGKGVFALVMLEKVGYISRATNRYVYPPENDVALYTNHSDVNNISDVYDKNISEEPFFITNRYIAKDEEITNNYNEFDEAIKIKKPEFL